MDRIQITISKCENGYIFHAVTENTEPVVYIAGSVDDVKQHTLRALREAFGVTKRTKPVIPEEEE